MRIFRRIFFGILVGMPSAVLVLAAGGYLWLKTSLPKIEGTLRLAGPESAVEILRDSHGVPHIRAANEKDAYFALGFVHAQDRLWQMELMRRTARGELAAMGGPRLLAQDRAMRTLGLGRLANGDLANLSAPVRRALDAYAAGINGWLNIHSGALPPEFYVAGIRPAPWKAEDSLLWGRLMALRLSFNWRTEALRAKLLQRLAPDKVAALWPPYPVDAPVTVPAPARYRKSGSPPLPSGSRRSDFPQLRFDTLAQDIPWPLSPWASNSWAVSGQRTATGRPILAGDPHLGFRAPNLWYLARVSAPGLSIAGATLPGMPFHVLGHNKAIGWTMTTTGADTQDLVIERLQAGDSGRYLTPVGARPFDTRTETIDVKGGATETLTIRTTRNGPVVSTIMDGTEGGAVIALRATMLAPDDNTAEALYGLNRAQNWTEFRAALQKFDSPVQNFLYGDTEGRIGYQMAGRIPMRRSGNGFAPVPGSELAYDWSGYIPFDRLPMIVDPKDGFVINANNRAVGPGYPYLITRDWANPYRAERIRQILDGQRHHALAASAAMQMDTLSLAARALLPLLLAATPKTEAIRPALELLADWDGHVLRTKPQPLIFNAWLRAIGPALIGDELGPLANRRRLADPVFIQRVLESDHTWCDDVSTPMKESCGSVLSGALAHALEDLRHRFGPDQTRWRWGDAHIARFRNQALAYVPLIGRFTDIEIATDGDTFTLNRGTTRMSSRRNPFAHGHGATFRAIYDFADLDRSLFIQPTGQSGNPLSPHYRDLIETWSDGGYLTMPSRPPSGLRRLRLIPE